MLKNGTVNQIAQKYGPAQYLLAQCYFQGLYGLDPDMEAAKYWLTRAYSTGFEQELSLFSQRFISIFSVPLFEKIK